MTDITISDYQDYLDYCEDHGITPQEISEPDYEANLADIIEMQLERDITNTSKII